MSEKFNIDEMLRLMFLKSGHPMSAEEFKEKLALAEKGETDRELYVRLWALVKNLPEPEDMSDDVRATLMEFAYDQLQMWSRRGMATAALVEAEQRALHLAAWYSAMALSLFLLGYTAAKEGIKLEKGDHHA